MLPDIFQKNRFFTILFNCNVDVISKFKMTHCTYINALGKYAAVSLTQHIKTLWASFHNAAFNSRIMSLFNFVYGLFPTFISGRAQIYLS
jgi:hypothetical protein